MHAASGGGFFDVDPPEPPPEPEFPPQPKWSQPPRSELPGRVVLDEVLFRDAATVVLLREVRAYGTGLVIALHWRHRRTSESGSEWDRWVMDGMRHHPGGLDEQAFRIGARLADGTRVLPFAHMHAWNSPDEIAPPTLLPLGGGGGGGPDETEQDVDAWLWTGAPVSGDLDVVVEWREVGVPETAHRVPADVLAAAPAPRPLWD